MIIESIKVGNNILVPNEGYIEQILVNSDDKVAGSELLAVLSDNLLIINKVYGYIY